jgi:AraC-like DNA-binding protein
MTRRPKHRPPRVFTQVDRQRLDRAADHYLQACYRSKTAARASEFAAFLNVTAPYLSRIVPDIVGQPVRDFLRAKQLARAEHLLRTTPAAIKVIAQQCAFGTLWTFHRWFRKAHGMAPGAFREVMK